MTSRQIVMMATLLTVGFNSVETAAQTLTGISFDGNIRYRSDNWSNINARYYGSNPAMGAPDDNILLQRIIAGMTLQFKKNITLSAHIQDSRALGWSLRNALEPDAFKVGIGTQNGVESYTMNPQEEFFEIYDLNIKVDSLLNHFKIIFGRQKIAFTDYRVFGPGEWGNTGRWNWDALKIVYSNKSWNSNIWAGGTKIHDPEHTYIPFTNTEYYGGGIHNEVKVNSFLNTDFYFAHKQSGSADFIKSLSINRNWAGFRIYNPELSNWMYEVSYTYEFGNESESRIKAFGSYAKFGYRFNSLSWRPRISLSHTYATGNKNDNNTLEVYDPAFGALDKFYGWMNIVKWTNVDDREFMLELFPVKGMRIEYKINDFRIPEPEGTKINGNLELPEGKNHLGFEFDLFIKYTITPSWEFVAAWGIFVPIDAQISGADEAPNANLLAFQVLYNFSFSLK